MSSKAKALTKAQLVKKLASDAGLSQEDVKKVIASLEATTKAELKRVGHIGWFGLLKVKKKDVKAKPARMGRNPATGEDMMFKAKPASKSVKVTALKSLKDMV